MKICFVERGYPRESYGGGAGTYVQLCAQELIKLGHKPFVITESLDGKVREFNDEGITVQEVVVKTWPWYFTKIPIFGPILAKFFQIIEEGLSINKKIKNIHRQFGLDVVELAETPNFLYSLFIKIPYVIHLHGSSFTFKKYCQEKILVEDKLQRYLEGVVIKRAKAIMSPSEFLKKEVSREFKIKPDKIKVIPYPIDQRLLLIKKKEDKDNKIVFYAGRLEKRKGIYILIEAIPLVAAKEPAVKFLFFGTEGKKGIKEEINTYLKNRNLSAKVEFYPFTPKNKLFDYLAAADICVVPSLWDNSPNVIYEAMAAGKAVVAAATGGIKELIVDNQNGVLFSSYDSKVLAEKIIDLLDNKGKREKISAQAQEEAAKRFNSELVTKERLKIYEHIFLCEKEP